MYAFGVRIYDPVSDVQILKAAIMQIFIYCMSFDSQEQSLASDSQIPLVPLASVLQLGSQSRLQFSRDSTIDSVRRPLCPILYSFAYESSNYKTQWQNSKEILTKPLLSKKQEQKIIVFIKFTKQWLREKKDGLIGHEFSCQCEISGQKNFQDLEEISHRCQQIETNLSQRLRKNRMSFILIKQQMKRFFGSSQKLISVGLTSIDLVIESMIEIFRTQMQGYTPAAIRDQVNQFEELFFDASKLANQYWNQASSVKNKQIVLYFRKIFLIHQDYLIVLLTQQERSEEQQQELAYSLSLSESRISLSESKISLSKPRMGELKMDLREPRVNSQQDLDESFSFDLQDLRQHGQEYMYDKYQLLLRGERDKIQNQQTEVQF